MVKLAGFDTHFDQLQVHNVEHYERANINAPPHIVSFDSRFKLGSTMCGVYTHNWDSNQDSHAESPLSYP